MVPAYKDEPSFYADGIHEHLIDENLFYEVQEVLEGRAPNRPTKNTLKKELPLRGILECRKCGKNISGSASRGNGGRYFYYHCTCGCNERFKAEDANDTMSEAFKTMNPNEGVLELNYEVLLDDFQSRNSSIQTETKRLDDELSRNKVRLDNARNLTLDGDFDAREYKELKLKIESANEELLRKKANLLSGIEDYKYHLDTGATIISNLDFFYQTGTLPDIQLIIGSVFPEKLIFENGKFRTIRLNESVLLMCLEKNELGQKKVD